MDVKQRDKRLAWGVLTIPYKSDRDCKFEGFIMLKKALYCLCVAWLSNYRMEQPLAIFILNFSFMVLLIVWRPYNAIIVKLKILSEVLFTL